MHIVSLLLVGAAAVEAKMKDKGLDSANKLEPAEISPTGEVKEPEIMAPAAKTVLAPLPPAAGKTLAATMAATEKTLAAENEKAEAEVKSAMAAEATQQVLDAVHKSNAGAAAAAPATVDMSGGPSPAQPAIQDIHATPVWSDKSSNWWQGPPSSHLQSVEKYLASGGARAREIANSTVTALDNALFGPRTEHIRHAAMDVGNSMARHTPFFSMRTGDSPTEVVDKLTGEKHTVYPTDNGVLAIFYAVIIGIIVFILSTILFIIFAKIAGRSIKRCIKLVFYPDPTAETFSLARPTEKTQQAQYGTAL